MAASGISVGVLDVHTIPVDEPAFLEQLAGIPRLVSLEEHVLPGGREIIRRTCGLDAESVERAIRGYLAAP
jgi:hypothetical protein